MGFGERGSPGRDTRPQDRQQVGAGELMARGLRCGPERGLSPPPPSLCLFSQEILCLSLKRPLETPQPRGSIR